MKKVIPLLVVALALTAFYYKNLWMPQPAGQANYLGYVEGETVLIAAPQAGRIILRPATKGARVSKNATIFCLDDAAAKAEVARTQAAVVTAQAQLDNLLSGKREPELEQIRAQRQEAEAGLVLAEKDLIRASRLSSSGTVSQNSLDQAQAAVAQFKARIAQFDASEQAASLAARNAEIDAAHSRVKEAQASAEQARSKLSDLSPLAPVDARVENTFFDVGEWVAAGQPVVSLLPPDAVTLRFFIAEQTLAKAQPGTTIHFTCDGCGASKEATITRVESTPEFTPPVIYSQGARAKLVFLVEAKPTAADPLLRPGLPIEVQPLP